MPVETLTPSRTNALRKQPDNGKQTQGFWMYWATCGKFLKRGEGERSWLRHGKARDWKEILGPGENEGDEVGGGAIEAQGLLNIASHNTLRTEKKLLFSKVKYKYTLL